MVDVRNIAIGSSLVLLGSLITIAGALIAFRPSAWFRFVNWWSRFTARGTLTHDAFSSDILHSAGGLFIFRLSGLAILLIGLFFVVGAGKATLQEMTLVPRVTTPMAIPASRQPVTWTGLPAAVFFLSIGVGLIYKPLATISFVFRRLLTSNALADPRTPFGLRILGMGFVLTSLFMFRTSLF